MGMGWGEGMDKGTGVRVLLDMGRLDIVRCGNPWYHREHGWWPLARFSAHTHLDCDTSSPLDDGRHGSSMPNVSYTILAIVDQRHRFGIDVLTGIDECARPDHWRILLSDKGELPADEKIDGAIGFFPKPPEALVAQELRARGVPVVVLNEDVVIDEAEVGRCAARHFHDRGLLNGAAVMYPENNAFSIPRCRGFAEVMSDPCPQFHMRMVDWSEQKVAFIPWLRALSLPVGIFAANDYVAQIVEMGCAEAGLSMPEDVAVLGVDNDVRLCLRAKVPLSSVRMPFHAQGVAGVERLRRLLAGQPAGAPAVVSPGSICSRASTDVLHCPDEEVSRALVFIRRQYATPVGIDVIADAIKVNRRTLERRFRTLLGRSIHDELRRVRVARAQDLLIEFPTLPVAAVATAIGLSSSSFAAAFAAEVGCSPGSWRSRRSG